MLQFRTVRITMPVAILYGPHATIFALCGLLGFAMGAMFGMALTFQVIRARSTDNAAVRSPATRHRRRGQYR